MLGQKFFGVSIYAVLFGVCFVSVCFAFLIASKYACEKSSSEILISMIVQ